MIMTVIGRLVWRPGPRRGPLVKNTKVQSGVECQEMGECQIRLPLRINPAEVRLQIIKAPEFYQEM